ncbi:hypothetical protein Tco_1203739 [Tanacetum coccineum]
MDTCPGRDFHGTVSNGCILHATDLCAISGKDNPKLSRGYTLLESSMKFTWCKNKFTPKLIQFSQSSNSQTDPKIQKDYKAEYKKMKSKLALMEASPSTPQAPKTFQTKNKNLVAETFDWDEEEVTDDEEVT